MTHDHRGIDTTGEPGENAGEELAAEPIPPVTSDWTPEVDDYRISTA